MASLPFSWAITTLFSVCLLQYRPLYSKYNLELFSQLVVFFILFYLFLSVYCDPCPCTGSMASNHWPTREAHTVHSFSEPGASAKLGGPNGAREKEETPEGDGLGTVSGREAH